MTQQEKDPYIKTWAEHYSNGRPAPLCYLTNRPCDVCQFRSDYGCSRWGCVFEEKIGEVTEDGK